MAGKKIVIFLGSAREGRQGGKVANYVKSVLDKMGMSAQIFDPLEMDCPVVRQPYHWMKDKSLAPSWMAVANEDLIAAHGFVVVMSEYNCGVPPALSNLMDHFAPASYRHRPCSVITYSMGDFAGIRAGALVLPLLNELGIFPLPARVALPVVHKKFDDEGQPTDTRFMEQVERMANELSWYADAIANQKTATGSVPK